MGKNAIRRTGEAGSNYNWVSFWLPFSTIQEKGCHLVSPSLAFTISQSSKLCRSTVDVAAQEFQRRVPSSSAQNFPDMSLLAPQRAPRFGCMFNSQGSLHVPYIGLRSVLSVSGFSRALLRPRTAREDWIAGLCCAWSWALGTTRRCMPGRRDTRRKQRVDGRWFKGAPNGDPPSVLGVPEKAIYIYMYVCYICIYAIYLC